MITIYSTVSSASACMPEEEVKEETEDVIANPQTQDDEEDNRVFRRYKWHRHQYDFIIGSIIESGHTDDSTYSDYFALKAHETKCFDIESGELDALYLSIIDRQYPVNLSGDICARIGRRCLMNGGIRYLWVKLCDLDGDQINGFFRHWDGRDSHLLGLGLMASNTGDSGGLGGMGMGGISRFLHDNRTLKELHLNHTKMNLDNARDLAATLFNESTTIPLVHIGLSGNEFGDEGVRLLSVALSKISTIETVDFSANDLTVFSSAAPLLDNHSFCVTKLNLENNELDDVFCAQFSTAIASSSRLKEVTLSGNEQITENGWKSILDVVQNTASIDALCSSNHTLTSIGSNEDFGCLIELENMQGPNCLQLMNALHTNSKYSSNMDTARRKIWLTYFHDEGVPLNELIELDSKIMPFVLSMFACRKEYHSYSHPADVKRHQILYKFVKQVPSLFVHPSPEKVRIMKLMEEKDQIIENLRLELEKVKRERDAMCTSNTSKRPRTDG